MSRISILALLLLLLIPALGITLDCQSARKELDSRQIPFATEEFSERVAEGDASSVKLFLEAGMDPNMKNSSGQPALIVAAIEGHTEIAKVLLENGADPNAASALSALMFTAFRGYPKVVRLILEHDADVNALDNTGISILMIAVHKANVDMVSALSWQMARGKTPLTHFPQFKKSSIGISRAYRFQGAILPTTFSSIFGRFGSGSFI
jgi:ankyrin repeat protein